MKVNYWDGMGTWMLL